jgi:hypothetical protein
MSSRFNGATMRIIFSVLVGMSLVSTGAASALAQHRATASAVRAPQIVQGGISHAGVRSGIVNLAKLPAASAAAIKAASQGAKAAPSLRTPTQLAAYQQYVRSHPSALPKATSAPAPTAGDITRNTYGNGALPVLLSKGEGLNSSQPAGSALGASPDQAVAAAPGYVFEGVSGLMEVFNTTYGQKYGPWTPDQFFASVMHSGDTFSDPQITYDPSRNKYLIAWLEIASNGAHDYLDIAISKSSTPSPLGNFYVYQIDPTTISQNWANTAILHPTLGYDYWGMYVTFIAIAISNGAGQGNRTFAFSLNNMLSGSLGGWDYWYSVLTDLNCPGSCNPAYQISPTIEDGVPQAEWVLATDTVWDVVSSNLTVCAITNTHAIGTATIPTYTCMNTSLPQSYADPAFGVAQPGTNVTLNPGEGFKQIAYRNGQLYFAMPMAVNCSGVQHTGIYWAVVDPQLTTLAAYTPQYSNGIYSNHSQAGVWCYSNADAFMPTLMAGTEGDMTLVFNISSASIYPSIAYTGRAAADAPNTLGQGGAWKYVVQGTHSSGLGSSWGNYSACALTTNMTTRGILYCGGLWGGPNTSLDTGWDTELYAMRME